MTAFWRKFWIDWFVFLTSDKGTLVLSAIAVAISAIAVVVSGVIAWEDLTR